MKKKILFIASLLFLVFNAHAQFQKGTLIVGGNVASGTLRVYDDFKNLNTITPYYVAIRPEIGYFLNNKWVVGARTDIRFAHDAYVFSAGNVALNRKGNDFSLTPFLRYYVNPKALFKVFYQLNMTGGFSTWQISGKNLINNQITTVTEDKKSYRTFQVDNSIGFNYFVGQNIALEGALNYVYYFKGEESDKTQPPTEISLPKLTFNPEFKMKFFLNTSNNDKDIVAANYLKKGNLTFGIKGISFLKTFDFAILTPSINYFIMDKLMIGSALNFQYQKNFSTYIGLTPEIRFYQPITKNMQVLLRGAYGAGFYYNTSGGTGGEFIKGTVQLQGGLNKFIAENISIEGLIDLGLGNTNDKTDFKPNVQFGLQYFMRKKTK
jgi:hypothetical protein